MFDIRPLREDDYPQLCDWWKWNRFPVLERDYLPSNGLGGIMIAKDGVDIVAGFLYFTNSKMCWLEFIVRNPKYRNKDAKEAIRLLIDELTGVAQRKGCKAIFSSIKRESLVGHYEACGFAKKEGTFEMVKLL